MVSENGVGLEYHNLFMGIWLNIWNDARLCTKSPLAMHDM